MDNSIILQSLVEKLQISFCNKVDLILEIRHKLKINHDECARCIFTDPDFEDLEHIFLSFKCNNSNEYLSVIIYFEKDILHVYIFNQENCLRDIFERGWNYDKPNRTSYIGHCGMYKDFIDKNIDRTVDYINERDI